MTNSHLNRESAVMMSSTMLIGEVFLLGVAGQILERHDGDGRLVGEREGWLQRGCRRALFSDRTDESEAFTWQCLDEALLLAGIAKGSPGGIQARCKCSIGNDAAVPNGVDKIVLADDALPVDDQVFEQIEHLRRNGNDIWPAMQFAPAGVECELLEVIAQVANPSQWPPFGGRHLRTPKE